MRTGCLAAWLITVFAADVCSQEPARADEATVAKLIEQLGSKSFRERQQALVNLARLPAERIVGPLQRASQSPDREVRRLARELLGGVLARQESDTLLKPSKLQLTYHHVAFPEALADFSRRTGMNVTLDDAEKARLAGKMIDLDTGDTTFWDAYRQLCKAGGVMEPAPEQTAQQPSPYADMERRGRRVIWMDGRHMPNPPRAEGFALRAGVSAEPTFTAGALRLRVLGGQGGKSPTAKDATLRFDVALEPRFNWDRIVSLRIDRAIDDQGQALEQSSVDLGEARPMVGLGEEVIVVWDGETEMTTFPRPRTTSLSVSLGKRPARTIKELRGVLAVQAEAPLETLVSVADVLASEKKVFPGFGDSSIRVLQASKDESGQIQLRVDVRMPARDADLPVGASRMVWLNRARGLRADGGAMTSEQVDKRGLALRDAKGQPVNLVSAKCDSAASPTGPFNYTMVYEPRKDQPGPMSLVLTGRRMVLLEVPFVLKDVPLP